MQFLEWSRTLNAAFDILVEATLPPRTPEIIWGALLGVKDIAQTIPPVAAINALTEAVVLRGDERARIPFHFGEIVENTWHQAVDDPDAALAKRLDQKNDLLAGRTPRTSSDELTVLRPK